MTLLLNMRFQKSFNHYISMVVKAAMKEGQQSTRKCPGREAYQLVLCRIHIYKEKVKSIFTPLVPTSVWYQTVWIQKPLFPYHFTPSFSTLCGIQVLETHSIQLLFLPYQTGSRHWPQTSLAAFIYPAEFQSFSCSLPLRALSQYWHWEDGKNTNMLHDAQVYCIVPYRNLLQFYLQLSSTLMKN